MQMLWQKLVFGTRFLQVYMYGESHHLKQTHKGTSLILDAARSTSVIISDSLEPMSLWHPPIVKIQHSYCIKQASYMLWMHLHTFVFPTCMCVQLLQQPTKGALSNTPFRADSAVFCPIAKALSLIAYLHLLYHTTKVPGWTLGCRAMAAHCYRYLG